MSKIKITKKGLSALALAALMTVSTGCSRKSNTGEVKQQTYSGITRYEKDKILDNDEFIIIDVGSYKTISKDKVEEILAECDNKDYSLGIIINSKAETLAEIYEDVEYAKKLVSEHTINYPLYINIDNILENDKLEVDKKVELITAFLEKCDANNIFMGIKGKDNNLCALQQIMDISTYDVYVVAKDKDSINFTGTVSMVEDKKGRLESKIEYRDLIEESGKNDPEAFKYDHYEIITEENTIEKISRKYNISVEDLLEYGDIKLKQAREENRVIRIPNKVSEENPSKINITFDRLEKPLLGCDMSIAQKETNTVWLALSKNFDYAIIRAYDGSNKDTALEEFYKESQKYGMNVGIYANNGINIHNANSHEEFRQKQQQQANKVIDIIKDKNIKYPVYLSIDQVTEENYDREAIETMLEVWKETMTKNGYIPGIYCNSFSYQNLKKIAGENFDEGLEMWLAGGDQFTGGRKSCHLSNITEPSNKTRYKDVEMFQCSDSVIGAGAGNLKGYLDVNMSYVDYANPVKTQQVSEDFVAQNLGIKPCDETQKRLAKTATSGLTLVGGAGAAALGIYLTNKNRHQGIYLRKNKKEKGKKLEKRK